MAGRLMRRIHFNDQLDLGYRTNWQCVRHEMITILRSNMGGSNPLFHSFKIIMKSRTLSLVFGLISAVLAIFLATAYAFNATETDPPTKAKPKNELIFNWGSGS